MHEYIQYMHECSIAYMYNPYEVVSSYQTYINIHMALSRLLHCPEPALFTHSQSNLLKITQQTSLPYGTADMSALGHSGHVCCVAQQACLLWKKQTSLLRDTADVFAV